MVQQGERPALIALASNGMCMELFRRAVGFFTWEFMSIAVEGATPDSNYAVVHLAIFKGFEASNFNDRAMP